MTEMIRELFERLKGEVRKVLVGQEQALELLFIALVADGHVLLQGVPGVAKTLLAKSLAGALRLRFRRVQFTPDLMPSDVIGTQVYNFQDGSFRHIEGPVFTNVLLADEINRAPAKTQAALLEAMQERQVSVDGVARPLPDPFLVLATQNPVEFEGTWPLPEAELDRFLFRIDLDYPSIAEEQGILALHGDALASGRARGVSVEPVATEDDLRAARAAVLNVRVDEAVARYIVDLVRATRDHGHVRLGGSPRATLLLQAAARVRAALEGRDYVVPDDAKRLFQPLLRHRLLLTASAEVEGLGADAVLKSIADGVAVPR